MREGRKTGQKVAAKQNKKILKENKNKSLKEKTILKENKTKTSH